MLEDNEGDLTSPKNIGITNAQEGYDQTPISEWTVSDDEEDSVPISQLLVVHKVKVTGHRKDNSEWGKRMERELVSYRLVLSCLVWSCLVMSCLACLVLSCFVLSKL